MTKNRPEYGSSGIMLVCDHQVPDTCDDACALDYILFRWCGIISRVMIITNDIVVEHRELFVFLWSRRSTCWAAQAAQWSWINYWQHCYVSNVSFYWWFSCSYIWQIVHSWLIPGIDRQYTLEQCNIIRVIVYI